VLCNTTDQNKISPLASFAKTEKKTKAHNGWTREISRDKLGVEIKSESGERWS